jgi:hypothetical protein
MGQEEPLADTGSPLSLLHLSSPRIASLSSATVGRSRRAKPMPQAAEEAGQALELCRSFIAISNGRIRLLVDVGASPLPMLHLMGGFITIFKDNPSSYRIQVGVASEFYWINITAFFLSNGSKKH